MPKKVNLKIDLESIAEKFDENDPKGKMGLTLLQRAIFMQEELKRLEKEIEEKGSVTEMSQGSYSIDRLNPATNAYNGMIKNFTSVIKQISDLIPVEVKEEVDAFEAFR